MPTSVSSDNLYLTLRKQSPFTVKQVAYIVLHLSKCILLKVFVRLSAINKENM